MKVLHVIGQLVPGGSEKMTLQIADRFRRGRGHDHRIAVLGELDESFVSALGAEAVPLYPLGFPDRGLPSGARAIRALAAAARREGFDLIQGHAWRSSIAAGAVGRIVGVPTVATLHRVYYPRTERVADRALQHLWRGVLVDSAAVRDRLAREVGLDAGRITVVPNFVADELFDDGSARAGERDGTTRILMAAHFTPVKGHRFALGALARLERAAPGRFQLDLLGDGPLLEESRRLARELGVERATQFHGRRSDLDNWLRRADVVLLPSLWEGFGVILAEAMACGRPAVAFDIGGATEVVVHGETGFLTPAGDSRALADALERLHDDPALRARMGDAGRARARRLYAAPRVLNRLERFYRELVGAR